MKKIFAISLMFLFLVATVATAAPFLVCDPQPNTVLEYVLTVDGTDYQLAVSIVDANTVRVVYDLDGIGMGTHNVELKSKTIWGTSTPVPFVFIRDIPPVPVNIKLEP
jgi:hypothetical protein